MTSIRKQIADILRYQRRNSDFHYAKGRPTYEECIETYDNTYSNVSLAKLVEGITVPLSEVFVRGYSTEDYDGYPEGHIELYCFRKLTDEEWLTVLTDELCPTKHQIHQYCEYLKLKEVFEKQEEK